MKKVLLSVSAALLILILAVSVYFIFFKGKSEQVDNKNAIITPTSAPSPSVAPTVTPLPDTTKEVTTLYPAFTKEGTTVKYGYINDQGSFVIEPAYDYACDYSEGIATVTQGENNLAIDETGVVIFENKNTINSFHNGVASFVKTVDDRSLYGYIDKKGQVIIDPQFTYASDFNDKDQAYVAMPDGKTYELIDKAGKVLESYTLDLGSNYVSAFEDGYVIYHDSVSMKDGVTFVTGDTILEPKYSSITYLGNDLFGVQSPDIENYQTMTEPAAIYNSKGKQLTDYKYYYLQHFNGKYASAADDTTSYFIDASGQEVNSLPSYDGSGTLRLIGAFVKSEVDGDLTYYRMDNTIMWQNDSTIHLTPDFSIKEMKFKPLHSVTVRYPKLEGLKDTAVQSQINNQLESIFTESRANITKEDQLTVDDSFTAKLTNNLLTIAMTGYDYSGGAHGMPLQEYYFIDITTGKFYEFKELFKKDSDYKKKIDDFINAEIDKDLKKGESMIFEGAFTGISDAQHFYLGSDSLIIYFYPYEISAYAAGFPEFTIPFAELTDCIDTEGAFWKAFH